MTGAIPTFCACTRDDLVEARRREQEGWEQAGMLGEWPRLPVSPWAEDIDELLAELDAKGCRHFVRIRLGYATYEGDLDEQVAGIAQHGAFVVGCCDGDDIVGFAAQEDHAAFLAWCAANVEAD